MNERDTDRLSTIYQLCLDVAEDISVYGADYEMFTRTGKNKTAPEEQNGQ